MEQKLKVLFIVPAHESNECLLDTIQNIQKFNTDIDCLICIRLNEVFTDFDYGLFSKLNHVIIHKSKYGNIGRKFSSQFGALLDAYSFSKSEYGHFDYVTIFHTSQLFVKTGYSKYIQQYDTTFKDITLNYPFEYDYMPKYANESWQHVVNRVPRNHVPTWKDNIQRLLQKQQKQFFQKLVDYYQTKFPYGYTPMIEMRLFENIFEDCENLHNYYYQGVEEGFYTQEIFEYVLDCVKNKFTVNLDELDEFFGYIPIEEVIIPTLAIRKAKHIGKNTIYWLENTNDVFDLCKLKEYHYSIKSIPRNYDHPIRVQIRNYN